MMAMMAGMIVLTISMIQMTTILLVPVICKKQDFSWNMIEHTPSDIKEIDIDERELRIFLEGFRIKKAMNERKRLYKFKEEYDRKIQEELDKPSKQMGLKMKFYINHNFNKKSHKRVSFVPLSDILENLELIHFKERMTVKTPYNCILEFDERYNEKKKIDVAILKKKKDVVEQKKKKEFKRCYTKNINAPKQHR